jgi:hypothetical protein
MTTGAVYLLGGIAAIVASAFGGKVADVAARANPQQPLRRLLYANLLGTPLMPLSIFAFGWGLPRGLPLAMSLAACLVASFTNCLYMPALFTLSCLLLAAVAWHMVAWVAGLLFCMKACATAGRSVV